MAFPKETRQELKETYELHKESLNVKIFCGLKNRLLLFSTENNEISEFDFELENIFRVRYIRDWETHLGKRDIIIAATKSGIIMFWDALTKGYIEGLEIGSNICEILFHPKKSEMITVCENRIGRELKIWKFDKYWSIIRIDIECLGDNKKLYYFDRTDRDVYIFSSNNSRLLKMYICNYDIEFPSIMNIPENFLNMNENYYEPLRINEDRTFECIKKIDDLTYFCKFRISNFEIEEIKLQPIHERNITILDFLKIGSEIYFQAKCLDYETIFKQTVDEYKIIYKTTNKILRMYVKNKFIVFFENTECKCIDLESLEIDIISIGELPVDFIVM
jgi:hypothetical protein